MKSKTQLFTITPVADMPSNDQEQIFSSGFEVSPHNMLRANSYDNDWQAAWIDNVKSILTTPINGINKIDGKVLQVGGSKTHSFAYGLWARFSTSSQTLEDSETTTWMHANIDSHDGWSWSNDGATAWDGAGWRSDIVDNIIITPELNDAQFAIIMFNTPDSSNPANLSIVEQRIDQLIAAGIVPVLSTIPPRTHSTYDFNMGNPYNQALREFAQNRSLPIIDYSQEIRLRRPNETWKNTLIGSDSVHSSETANGFDAGSDPYTPGGDPNTHTTGDAVLNSNSLLRTWLAVQKMKEIKLTSVDSLSR